MAILNHTDEAWWRYAVEFARRGLWPIEEIETHGPHERPADRIWGSALATFHDGAFYEVAFAGPHGRRQFSCLSGLRFYDEEDPETRFPKIGQIHRSAKCERWLTYAHSAARRVARGLPPYRERRSRRMFQAGNGDWTQYRKLPDLLEVDFHRSQDGPRPRDVHYGGAQGGAGHGQAIRTVHARLLHVGAWEEDKSVDGAQTDYSVGDCEVWDLLAQICAAEMGA